MSFLLAIFLGVYRYLQEFEFLSLFFLVVVVVIFFFTYHVSILSVIFILEHLVNTLQSI